jgi:hypothetical protein
MRSAERLQALHHAFRFREGRCGAGTGSAWMGSLQDRGPGPFAGALPGSGWKGEAPFPQRILDLLLNENLEVKREGKYEMAHRTQKSHSRATFVNDT